MFVRKWLLVTCAALSMEAYAQQPSDCSLLKRDMYMLLLDGLVPAERMAYEQIGMQAVESGQAELLRQWLYNYKLNVEAEEYLAITLKTRRAYERRHQKMTGDLAATFNQEAKCAKRCMLTHSAYELRGDENASFVASYLMELAADQELIGRCARARKIQNTLPLIGLSPEFQYERLYLSTYVNEVVKGRCTAEQASLFCQLLEEFPHREEVRALAKERFKMCTKSSALADDVREKMYNKIVESKILERPPVR